MDLKSRVDELAALMSEFQLLEGCLEGEGWKVALKKSRREVAQQQGRVQLDDDFNESEAIASAPHTSAPVEAAKPKGMPVSSPMAGIYYTASSPSAPPFVRAGEVVEAGQVVGLIEAMKVFNEIVAPLSGTVTEITASNGQLVQPGEALLYIG